jgi:hypothetical protein
VNILPVFVLASVVAATAACSSDKADEPPCPRVAVLKDAATLTQFAAPSGRDMLDVDFQAEITDSPSRCRLTKGDKGPVVVVETTPVFVASRGPANKTRAAKFRYFVSVVGADGTILTKQEFDVAVAFEGNRRRTVHSEEDPAVTVDLPLADPRQAGTYEILLGFQLTQEQLDYNRREQGGRY